MRTYKRGRYWWVAWPGDERESTGQTTKEAADRWCRRRELERADPAHAAARAATVARLIVAFLADRREVGRSAATLEFYEQKLGHVARLLGDDTPLSDLTPRALDHYQAQRLSERAKRATVTKEVKALAAALRRAKRWGWYPGDLGALLPVDLETGYTPRARWLPPEELDLLLDELGEVAAHHAAAAAYAVASGARASEVARCTRGDLEAALEAGEVQIRGTKTRKSKGAVAVLSLFRPLLERALAGALPGPPEAPAFGDWPRRRGNSLRGLANACARAGIAAATWNDLRRSHGRWLRRAGVEVELIAEQLRHSSPATTRRVYAQIETAEVAEQIEARLRCPPAVRATPETTGNDGV